MHMSDIDVVVFVRLLRVHLLSLLRGRPSPIFGFYGVLKMGLIFFSQEYDVRLNAANLFMVFGLAGCDLEHKIGRFDDLV